MQTLSQGQKKVTIFWYLVWVARLVTMKSIDRPTISGFFGPVERVTTEFCCIFSLYYVMEHEWLWASNGQKRKTWTSPERTVYCQSCDYRLTTRVKTLASLPKERGRVWPELGHTDVRASLLLSSPQQLLLLLVDQQRPPFFPSTNLHPTTPAGRLSNFSWYHKSFFHLNAQRLTTIMRAPPYGLCL